MSSIRRIGKPEDLIIYPTGYDESCVTLQVAEYGNESENTEYKQLWRSDSLKVISAFANAKGGVLHIGLDDWEKPVGIQNVMNMSFEVVDTLFLNYFVFEAGNATQMLQMSLFSVSHTTDGNGNMFVAEASPESYRIEGWNLAGENFTTIAREFDPVEKTAEEIARESERISRMIEARNPGIRHTYTPILSRNQIPPNGVHADGLGRLWVLNGFSDTPVFDVYSYEGEMLEIDPNEIQEVLWWNVFA